jgi:hypothetical protein
VENHRAGIMKRTGSKSLPALARLALLASGGAEAPSPSGRAGHKAPPDRVRSEENL